MKLKNFYTLKNGEMERELNKKILLFAFCIFASIIMSAQQETIIYNDDFSSLSSVWSQYKGNSDAIIQNGKLQIKSSKTDAIRCYYAQIFINYLKNFSIEISIKQISGEKNQGLGIIWGSSGIENSNLFLITASGYYSIGKYIDDKYSPVQKWTKSDLINPTGFNILKVEKKANNLIYYINNKAIYTEYYYTQYISHIQGFALQNNINCQVEYIKISNDIPKIEIADISFKGKMKNIGTNINTKNTEIAPIISPDGQTLYFARGWSTNNFGKNNDEADIWYSQKQPDGTWGPAKNIGKPLNNKGVNVVINVTPDGNTLYLEGLYNSDGSFKSDQGISVSHKTETGWSVPQQVRIDNFYNKNHYETYNFTTDQQVLLLSVERDDTYGDLDLYVSFRRPNGTYTEPKNIGPQINTYADEGTPFVAPDGTTMYFSTSGLAGYGSNDIYVTKRLDDTWLNWSKPLNLGSAINSINWDTYLSLSARGDTAFLVSTSNSYGNEDLFTIEMPPIAQPDPVVIVKGNVYDKETNKPIGAKITYTDIKTKKEVGIAQSNPKDGSYQIVLPYGKNFSFYAEAKEYISIRENIDLTKSDKYKEINKNLYLAPAKIGEIIVLNNVFFEKATEKLLPESEEELNSIVKILKDNKKMEIELRGHTDNRGNAKQLLDLSEKRVIIVKKYLVNKGIDSTRISTKAFGGSMPININNSEEEHAKNRRVEFRILKM